uniref:Uncharacterized protein n=1 Tax=Arundo donax TaxID=35708 RepID=A0A0A9FYY9_ARUDO
METFYHGLAFLNLLLLMLEQTLLQFCILGLNFAFKRSTELPICDLNIPGRISYVITVVPGLTSTND